MDSAGVMDQQQQQQPSVNNSMNMFLPPQPGQIIATPELLNPSTQKKRIIQAIVDMLATGILFIAYFIVLTVMSPRIAYYTCDQSDVSYPFIPDTVAFLAVVAYCTLPPLLVMVLVELGNARLFPFQNSFGISVTDLLKQFSINLFHATSLFSFGIAFTLLLAEIGKRWIGRLRPHFLSVCKTNLANLACITNAATGSIFNSVSTGGSFCTGASASVKEARLSMPSGHASFAFFTMVFLVLYLQYRLFLLRFRFAKALVQATAFITAFTTSISRIVDYQHRGSDVIAGMVLGTLVAIFTVYFVGYVLYEYDSPYQYSDFDQKPTVLAQPKPILLKNPMSVLTTPSGFEAHQYLYS